MDSEPLLKPKANVGVVGLGYWGKNLVRNFHDLGALGMLCDTDESAGARFERLYPGVRFCNDYSKVLADPTIQAVALATPAVTHYNLSRAALEAGKDVLVEKPLAIDVKDGEELVRLAAAKGQNPYGRAHPPVSPGDPEAAAADPGTARSAKSITCTPTG